MTFAVAVPPTFGAWKRVVDALLRRRIAPDDLDWSRPGQNGDLFAAAERGRWEPLPEVAPPVTLPSRFLDGARYVAHHRDDERWALLYRLAARLDRERPDLLSDPLDRDVRRFDAMEKSVRRDAHKMKAFVRFRETPQGYFAWYEPDHRTLPLVAGFFRDRFRPMHWHLLTPDLVAEWDRTTLTFGPGVARAPRFDDRTDDLWRTYYRATYNPTRTRLRAMRKEMPTRFWKHLPESREIAPALREAPVRAAAMAEARAVTALPYVPPAAALAALAALAGALPACRGCTLYRTANCAVPGEGLETAEVVVVGEQPGDEEDRVGRPFVGPAGRLLDTLLERAGVARQGLYVTNAVKHFRFRQEGSYRLHQKPREGEIAACRPWLEAELRAVRPKLVVCLGLSAAFSVLGRHVALEAARRTWHRTPYAPRTVVIRHPSSCLRTADLALRTRFEDEIVDDLRWALAAP